LRLDYTSLNTYPKHNGVYILSEITDEFESVYLKVRDKEQRVYSDGELKHLPFATEKNPHIDEWKLRAKSFLRFKNYIKSRNERIKLLDLGCGNGWFCGQMAKYFDHDFYGIDVNLTELVQARNVFNSNKINFIYADIFSIDTFTEPVDIITINAAAQYFPDLKILINKLFNFLNSSGELHIIDTPFYSAKEVEQAKKRTENYYQSIDFPEMAKNYFHHSLKDLSEFRTDLLYNQNSIFKRITNTILNDSPFPWIRIKQ